MDLGLADTFEDLSQVEKSFATSEVDSCGSSESEAADEDFEGTDEEKTGLLSENGISGLLSTSHFERAHKSLNISGPSKAFSEDPGSNRLCTCQSVMRCARLCYDFLASWST